MNIATMKVKVANSSPLLSAVATAVAVFLLFALVVQQTVVEENSSRPWSLLRSRQLSSSTELVDPHRSRSLLIDYENPKEPVILQSDESCRPNVISYLVQKTHGSYHRDSYGLFLKSLDLLHQNYLSVNENYRNVHVFIFHTGDYTQEDLDMLHERYPSVSFRVVDLTYTVYYSLPFWLRNDDRSTWAWPTRFSVGYRSMMRWYALQIFKFFDAQTCRPEYVMRMDEESFIYSRIEYNIFDFMKSHDYNYGFRQCSYEMKDVEKSWTEYKEDRREREPTFDAIRPYDKRNCGFYNNFFITKLDFFKSQDVQDFMNFVDRRGYMYRERTNDLILQTMAVYAFSPPEKIHRFLDFTYEHFTVWGSGCPAIGGLSAGYNDLQGKERVDQMADHFVGLGCKGVDLKRHLVELPAADMSPTYNHLTPEQEKGLKLWNFHVATVETLHHGHFSG